MTTEQTTPETSRLYATAHTVHYVSKDLRRALELYWEIVVEHSKTQEAENAKAQIENIVRAVVPKEVLFETQIECALEQFRDNQPNTDRIRLAPTTPQESH